LVEDRLKSGFELVVVGVDDYGRHSEGFLERYTGRDGGEEVEVQDAVTWGICSSAFSWSSDLY